MAILYGEIETAKKLIDICPNGIENIRDINDSLQILQRDLRIKKETFYNNLPNVIEKENQELKELENKQVEIEKFWNDSIETVKQRKKEYKQKTFNERKVHLIFMYLMFHLKSHKLRFWKNVKIKKHRKVMGQKKDRIEKLESKPDEILEEETENLKLGIEELEQVKGSKEYAAAYGETLVLNELKKLNNDYHVFCDFNVILPDYIRHGGKRNLRTAQIDFVVVGRSGIFVIEAKNWSSDFLKNYGGFSPHEQTDRNGLALFFKLNNLITFKPRVNKRLVSVKGNIKYDPNFKSVYTTKPSLLRKNIIDSRNKLSYEQTEEVVSALSRCY